MRSRFLPDKEEDTVLNYFVLPLIGESKKQFGAGFITTRVAKDARKVLVQVIDEGEYDEVHYRSHVILEDKHYLVYDVPKEFVNDVMLILKGKYRKLSEKAKNKIRFNSGLSYKKKMFDKVKISTLLLALEEYSPRLIEYYFDKLKVGNKESDEVLWRLLHDVDLAEKVQEEELL